MSTVKTIGEVLLDAEAITKAQLNEAAALEGRRPGRIDQLLLSLGHLTEETFIDALGRTAGAPDLDLRAYQIDRSFSQYVPLSFAVDNAAMPIDRVGERLTLAVARPLPADARSALEGRTGLTARDVLCKPDSVYAAITEAYTNDAEELPGSDQLPAEAQPVFEVPPLSSYRLRNVLHIVRTLDQLPLLSSTHLRVLDRLDNPDVDVADLTGLIEQDPLLSANVLRLANSAAFAGRQEFAAVQPALVQIGLRELRSIVLVSAVVQTLNGQTDENLTELFAYAFRCGLLSKILCDVAAIGARDIAFTAGLLSTMGRIVLRLYSPEYADRIDRSGGVARARRLAAEHALIGVAASELAYILACRWNLPFVLAKSIRFHDRIEVQPVASPITAAVALAHACLEHQVTAGGWSKPQADSVVADLAQRCGLTDQSFANVETMFQAASGDLPVLGAG